MQCVHPARSRFIPRIVAMLAVAGALVAGLAACGFKGPLYMPGSPQDHQRRQPPPALKPGQLPPDTAPATPADTPADATTASPETDDASTAQPGAAQRAPVPNLFQ